MLRAMADDAAVFEVLLQPSHWRFAAPAGLPVLNAAALAGIALPSSCRNGTCRSCMCRLRSGRIVYRIEWPGLSSDEKEAGWILPCVAHPLSNLELDAPGASRLEPVLAASRQNLTGARR